MSNYRVVRSRLQQLSLQTTGSPLPPGGLLLRGRGRERERSAYLSRIFISTRDAFVVSVATAIKYSRPCTVLRDPVDQINAISCNGGVSGFIELLCPGSHERVEKYNLGRRGLLLSKVSYVRDCIVTVSNSRKLSIIGPPSDNYSLFVQINCTYNIPIIFCRLLFVDNLLVVHVVVRLVEQTRISFHPCFSDSFKFFNYVKDRRKLCKESFVIKQGV